MIKTIDTEYFDEKIQAAMKNAMDITGSTWRWCPIALKAALELMPAVEPAQRCNCCGYLVTESEHRGCLKSAAQAEEIERLKQIKDDLNARLITATLKNVAKDKRIAELEQALRDVKEWVDRYTSPGHPVSTVCAKALEGKP